jgi:hypothetical protein
MYMDPRGGYGNNSNSGSRGNMYQDNHNNMYHDGGHR